MRYIRFVVVCLGVAVLVSLVDAQEKAQSQEEITRILKEAREHLVKRDAAIAADKQKEGDKENDQFRALLTSVADKFPTVTPTRDEGKGKGKGRDDANKYTRLTLNTHGAKLDAIRFKAPGEKGNWQMHWEYVRPADTKVAWSIAGRNYVMTDAFVTHNTTDNFEEKGAELPKENKRITQRCAVELNAKEEYIIWISFEKDEPVDLHIRINLTRPKK
jgi:hypothetical protein